MSAARLTHEQYCDALGLEIERFADAVRGVLPDLEVPTCPDWTLADLVKHIGMTQRWAAQMVRDLAPERLDRSTLDFGIPADEEDFADWLAAGAGPVVDAFRAADPEAPMWAWGADQRVRFWPRRMLHETTVHYADAEMALGGTPAIDATVAADGIDELLENLPHAAYFAPGVTELRGDGEALHLHATDAEAEWTIRLHADGFTWDRDHSKATTAARGPIGDLFLLMYGRRHPADKRLEVLGDEAFLARWLENSAL